MRLALDVLEDLPSLLIEPAGTRGGEALRLEIAEESMHRRRPRPGSAAHRVADADRVVEIAAERSLLSHTLRVSRSAQLEVAEGLRGRQVPGRARVLGHGADALGEVLVPADL